MSISSINTSGDPSFSSQREAALRYELVNLFITSQKVQIEIGKLHGYISDAQENLRRAEVEKFCFITDCDTVYKIALLNYAYSMQHVEQAARPPAPYVQLTQESWEAREPTAEELESLGSVSKVEVVGENSGDIFLLDSYSNSIKPLKEEGLKRCVQGLGERVTSLETERQGCIDKLARIRFNTQDIHDKIRLFTPEKERLIELARQYSPVHSQPPPSPKLESSPQKTKTSWKDSICNFIKKICGFFKNLFRFVFFRKN